MAAVSTRYADALINSVDNKDEICKYLENIATFYKINSEFKETFNNPRITDEVKLDIIKEMISDKKEEKFLNFISLILKENRFNLIDDIYKKYQGLLDEINKNININIITSSKLLDEEIQGITEKFKKIYSAKEVNYKVSIDESLIGGVKVIAGGKVYDDTIKTKLDEML